jgi:hypothetical protein
VSVYSAYEVQSVYGELILSPFNPNFLGCIEEVARVRSYRQHIISLHSSPFCHQDSLHYFPLSLLTRSLHFGKVRTCRASPHTAQQRINLTSTTLCNCPSPRERPRLSTFCHREHSSASRRDSSVSRGDSGSSRGDSPHP